MEPDTKPNNKLEELLQTVVSAVQTLQEQNEKVAKNHAEAIEANRQAFVGLATLVNQQCRAFNITRNVVITLWEESHPPASDQGTEESVH